MSTMDEATTDAHIEGLRGLRLVTPELEQYHATVAFYARLLGRPADEAIDDDDELLLSAVWRLADGLDLIICRELQSSRETYLDEGPAWIALSTPDPDSVHATALERGLELLNDPIDTAFGTRGFFCNDPAGFAIYVGTPWPSP